MSKSPTDAILSCVTCGGPLPLGSETCKYCNSRYDSDVVRAKYTKVSMPLSARSCPRCEKPMETQNIIMSETFNVERCSDCFGVFLDSGELEGIINLSKATTTSDLDRKRINELMLDNGTNGGDISYMKCPVCSNLMNRKNYGLKSGVVVDTCVSHGVWLDGGKIGALIRWAELGGSKVDCPLDKERERLKKEREELERQLRLERANSSIDF